MKHPGFKLFLRCVAVKRLLLYNISMTLIQWLLIAEVFAAIGIVIWLFRRMHKHAKHSPAQAALTKHLQELELAKQQKESKKEDS